jgi:CRISPR/Cas system-associated endoribonuclease Cas2
MARHIANLADGTERVQKSTYKTERRRINDNALEHSVFGCSALSTDLQLIRQTEKKKIWGDAKMAAKLQRNCCNTT